MEEDFGVCNLCGRPIESGDLTLDIYVSNTRHHSDIGRVKTMMEPDNIQTDYIMVGESCCGQRVRELWAVFTGTLLHGTEDDNEKDE